jgi:hypothetical protein
MLISCVNLDENRKKISSLVKPKDQCIDSLKLLFESKLAVDFEFDTTNCAVDSVISKNNSEMHLIYFTSYACINCRIFENNVFFKEEITSAIMNSFTPHVLFVDYSTSQSSDLCRLSSEQLMENVRTAIHNSQLQIRLAKAGYQPYICAVNANCELVDCYKGKLSTLLEFKNWLERVRI